MAQRGITESDVIFVHEFGRRIYAGKAVHCFLGRRDIPPEYRSRPELMRCEGTVVVLDAHTGTKVLTVYRNRQALKRIRRKAKTR
ncbi:MAG TPA: DUF4258 domain-containing protein [Chloroflexi bacterium]|nr:DUF4258 domain-containing protein [Chloroflexota bacterium]